MVLAIVLTILAGPISWGNIFMLSFINLYRKGD